MFQTEEGAGARSRGERRLGICEGQVTAWAPGRRKEEDGGGVEKEASVK